MARSRKTARDLVPDERPLEDVVEAEDAAAGRASASESEGEGAPQTASPPSTERPVAKPPKARKARTEKAPRPAGERKPIVRLPKPEHERGRRKERRGVVVSSAMDKTIVVRVDAVKPDPRYKKVVRRSRKFHAHDAENAANVGDVVRIVETRPLSKSKNWRLAEVVERAR